MPRGEGDALALLAHEEAGAYLSRFFRIFSARLIWFSTVFILSPNNSAISRWLFPSNLLSMNTVRQRAGRSWVMIAATFSSSNAS